MKISFHIFSIVLIISTSACSTKPYAIDYTNNPAKPGTNKIYIINHGRHTGFAIPSSPITTEIPTLKKLFGNPPFIEFGWGDYEFYQAEEITLWLKFQAVLWPTNTVMHVVAIPKTPPEYFSNQEVVKVSLNDQQFTNLIFFLINSFYHDESGNIIPLKKGDYGHSLFFKGAGKYHLFNTCNKWTAKGLKSAGLDISPTFQITADGLMEDIKETNKVAD